MCIKIRFHSHLLRVAVCPPCCRPGWRRWDRGTWRPPQWSPSARTSCPVWGSPRSAPVWACSIWIWPGGRRTHARLVTETVTFIWPEWDSWDSRDWRWRIPWWPLWWGPGVCRSSGGPSSPPVWSAFLSDGDQISCVNPELCWSSYFPKYWIISKLYQCQVPAVACEARQREDQLLVVSVQQVEEEHASREDDELSRLGEVDQVETQDFNMSPTLGNSFDLNFELTLPAGSPTLE